MGQGPLRRSGNSELLNASRVAGKLLPVRNPDVIYLRRVPQEPSALGLSGIKPVDHTPFIREHLLKVTGRERIRDLAARFVSETPDGVDVVVFGKSLQKLTGTAADDIDDTTGEITGVE